MEENQLEFTETGKIELAATQRQVLELLRTAKSQKYFLADWYYGAIHAAKNTCNPDRFSQAAHSLRELLEKLPRVFVESEVCELRKPGFKEKRKNLHVRLSKDKIRYNGKWNDKKIDKKLDKTIKEIERYFQLNQIPTRNEQIHSMISKIDPMHDILDQKIRNDKYEQFNSAWNFFEGLSHHKIDIDENSFWQKVAEVDRMLIDLLAPTTAQDQGAIRAILEKPQPEQGDVDSLLELIKCRGANYAYFFKTANNPIWIDHLQNFFNNPPNVEETEDGCIIAPLWWPILYLQKISRQNPKQVVEIIEKLWNDNPRMDNPRILREIFSIACDLKDTALSFRLKPLIMQFLKSPYQWIEEDLVVKILKKWGSDQGPSRNAACEIIQYVIAFQPDPKADEKRSLRKENPEAWTTLLEPAPRFDRWTYQQILEKGVRPLAEHEPYQVSRILIDAVARMIRLGMHEAPKGEDWSESWCRRLDKPDGERQDAKQTLVQTLTHACEQVYARAPESIDALDQALKKQGWKVFKRLRQHLHASHPSDQTLPWMREQILGRDDYHKWEHGYEFQLMIRKASERFGLRLLGKEELKKIVDLVLSGPSKEAFRERMGKRYSEEGFQQYQRRFHRMQLRPFDKLLGGEVRRYFDELEGDASAEAVDDDSYPPFRMTWGWGHVRRSPKSAEDLERLADEELLSFLNDWNEEHWENDKDNGMVEISISALVDVFRSLFKERIVPDGKRLAFWMANRERLARPVYVAAMLEVMLELVKGRDFDKLDLWIEFCEWVLSHSDTVQAAGQAEPRDHIGWGSSRRAVVDFVDACASKDVDAPIAARDGLAALLRQASCQPDWQLDHLDLVLPDRENSVGEAINIILVDKASNNTRSRAIESLVNFGFWVRRQLPEAQLPELTDILEKRMAKDAEIPLARPERALLGMHFGSLCALDREWAVQQRETLFPRANPAAWWDAFGSYILFNRPNKPMFEILRGELEHATEKRKIIKKGEVKELVDRLGERLFDCYIWEFYPLTGDESLLERFYEKTKDDRKCWGRLFDHVGTALKESGRQLDKALTDRIVAFFDWRLEAAEPLELQEFASWLEAECLSPDWRLRSYSKILDFGRGTDAGAFRQIDVLNKLLPTNQALVVECFAKITDAMDQGTQMYISADDAKPILSAGLKAEARQIREHAERARENLLRLGYYDCLER